MAKKKQDEHTDENSRRYLDVIRRYRPGKVREFISEENGLRCITHNGIELRIRPVTSAIIRLSYLTAEDGEPGFSYAVDPEFEAEPVSFSVDEKDDRISLKTDLLEVRISREGLSTTFYDRNGNLLSEEGRGFSSRHSLMSGPQKVSVGRKAPKGAAYFGLGDKAAAGGQNLRGTSFTNWNTDAYAYERGDDPLYRSIPFFIELHEGRAYGIFMDNTYCSRFDFDSNGKGEVTFSAEGGVMDYYFIYGPELTSVAKRYTRLTGTPDMPPLWALGYHQSRWSYYPEQKVRELARTFHEKEIPCDAIYLDIDYMDGYRCFTWNKDRFPEPQKMIADLKKQGFHTVVMIDPGIKAETGYDIYDEGMENGFFCRRPDGETFLGPVWPERCAFPDFTDPEARKWWSGLYKEFLEELDVAGIWNDMNEPALFEVRHKTFPDDIRHRNEEEPCSHRKVHNVYGMQMARASLEGIKKHAPDRRPFLLSRAAFSGGQRFAALWTGDNIADWDHLRLAHEQCLRLSVSGFSFVGSDIGGFVKEPDGELYTRWLQLGVFHPLFRSHSMGYHTDGAALVDMELEKLEKHNDANRREPWSFGEEFTAINRETIRLRYRLLDYLYTAFYDYVTNGSPVLKSLAFESQDNPKIVAEEDAFLFGNHLLAAPVFKKKKRKVKIRLPDGEWYLYWDNKKYRGGKKHTADAPLERLPFFVRAGSLLPLREAMQHTGERKLKQKELRLYFGRESTTSTLYEDAGEGWAHEEGGYLLSRFDYEYNKDNGLRLIVSREGSFDPGYGTFKLKLIGLPFEVSAVMVDGAGAAWESDDGVYRLDIPRNFEELIIR